MRSLAPIFLSATLLSTPTFSAVSCRGYFAQGYDDCYAELEKSSRQLFDQSVGDLSRKQNQLTYEGAPLKFLSLNSRQKKQVDNYCKSMGELRANLARRYGACK